MDSKLTLADIANKAGITMSYLSRIEADLLIPKPDTLENIVTALQDDISTYIPFLLKKYFREDSPIHRFNDEATEGKWEELGDDFTCPECGVGKEDYVTQ